MTTEHIKVSIENAFHAAPNLHLLKVQPNEKAPLRGTKWRENPLSKEEAIEWVMSGERLGIVPITGRIGVLDLDHGGQAMLDAVVEKYGEPLAFLPSTSAVEGVPRGHILYPTDIATGNGKWVGGDLRVDNGYVVIKDIDGLVHWSNAIGMSIHRWLPEIDLNTAKGIHAPPTSDPEDYPEEDNFTSTGWSADSSVDPMEVPDEPVHELRHTMLRTILRAVREAKSMDDLNDRAERCIAWFGACRQKQADAGWDISKEINLHEADVKWFRNDIQTRGKEKFDGVIAVPKGIGESSDPVAVLLNSLRLSDKNRFHSYNDAVECCDNFGVIVLPGEYRDETLFDALNICGFSFRWNSLMARLEISDGNETWECVGGSGLEGARLRAAMNEVSRYCAVIRPEIVKSIKTGDYFIERIVHGRAWGKNAADLYGAVMGCVNHLIFKVNPLTDWVDKKIARFESLPEDNQKALVESLGWVFHGIPGIKPREGAHSRIATHCGRYLFTMMGHRLLQSHPEYKHRAIKRQRNVPVMAGEPGTGKTTIMSMLVPMDLPLDPPYANLEIEKDNDEIKRLIAGRLIGIFDDLDQIAGPQGGRNKGRVKALITMTQMDFRWMRENPVSIPNPAVFVGTANELNLPNDDGTQVRFLPFMVEANRLDGETGNQVAKRAEAYIKTYLDGWVMAGLWLAVQDESFELDSSGLVDQRVALADVAADPGDVECTIRQMIATGLYVAAGGYPAIAPYQVAHWLGVLKMPYTMSQGAGGYRQDNIVRGKSIVDDTALLSAYNGSPKRPEWEHKIREGMRKVGWELKRGFVKVGIEGGEMVLSNTYRPQEGGVMPPESLTPEVGSNVVTMIPPRPIPPPTSIDSPSERFANSDYSE